LKGGGVTPHQSPSPPQKDMTCERHVTRLLLCVSKLLNFLGSVEGHHSGFLGYSFIFITNIQLKDSLPLATAL
jgi:hypothetical protein